MIKKISIILIMLLILFACEKKQEEYPDVKLGQTEEEIKETVEQEQDIPDFPDEPKKEESKPQPEPPKQKVYSGARDYEVQLLSLKDHSRVLLQQEILKNHGYETKILETYKDGQLLYRLRLKERYTKEEATVLGEEIKAKFSAITSYWVQKVR
jgi:cell division septation protein DedD